MEEVKDKIEDLTNHLGDLGETFYKLTLIKATEKAAQLVAGAVTTVAVCVTGLFVLLFGGLALSWWLGDLLNNRIGGFLLGALFFLVLMIVALLLRKKIISPFIKNLIARKAYE